MNGITDYRNNIVQRFGMDMVFVFGQSGNESSSPARRVFTLCVRGNFKCPEATSRRRRRSSKFKLKVYILQIRKLPALISATQLFTVRRIFFPPFSIPLGYIHDKWVIFLLISDSSV